MPYYGEASAQAEITVSQQSTTTQIDQIFIEAMNINDADYGMMSVPPQAFVQLLKAKVLDAQGNPIPNLTANWTVEYLPPGATTPTTWFSGTLTTDENGVVDFGFDASPKQLTIDEGQATVTVTFEGTAEYAGSSGSLNFYQEIRVPDMGLFMDATIVWGTDVTWRGYIKDPESTYTFYIYDKTIYLQYSADGGATWNNCTDPAGNPETAVSQASEIGMVDSTGYNFEDVWTVNLDPGTYLFRAYKPAGSPGVETGEAYSPPIAVRVLSPEEAEELQKQQMMTTLGIGLALAGLAGAAYYLYKRKR